MNLVDALVNFLVADKFGNHEINSQEKSDFAKGAMVRTLKNLYGLIPIYKYDTEIKLVDQENNVVWEIKNASYKRKLERLQRIKTSNKTDIETL